MNIGQPLTIGPDLLGTSPVGWGLYVACDCARETNVVLDGDDVSSMVGGEPRGAKAWAFFRSRAPWYQRAATFWVVSAKQPARRERRVRTLIADCAAGRTIGPLTFPAAKRLAAKRAGV